MYICQKKPIMAYFNVLTKINIHNLHNQIMLIFKKRKKNHITYITLDKREKCYTCRLSPFWSGEEGGLKGWLPQFL